jgi:hypothetical protein
MEIIPDKIPIMTIIDYLNFPIAITEIIPKAIASAASVII